MMVFPNSLVDTLTDEQVQTLTDMLFKHAIASGNLKDTVRSIWAAMPAGLAKDTMYENLDLLTRLDAVSTHAWSNASMVKNDREQPTVTKYALEGIAEPLFDTEAECLEYWARAPQDEMSAGNPLVAVPVKVRA